MSETIKEVFDREIAPDARHFTEVYLDLMRPAAYWVSKARSDAAAFNEVALLDLTQEHMTWLNATYRQARMRRVLRRWAWKHVGGAQ